MTMQFEDYVKSIVPSGPAALGGSGAVNCTPLLQAIDAYKLVLQADGYIRRYWGDIWDSHTFDMAVPASSQAKLYQVPLGSFGKTIQQTNFWGSGLMPDRNAMFIHSIALNIVPPIDLSSPATDWWDQLMIQQNLYINCRKNQAMYGEWMAVRLPLGGGPSLFTTPNFAGTAGVTMNNGWPGKEAAMREFIPIVLSPLEQFEWNLQIDPNAWTAITNHHATAQIFVQLFLEGEIYTKVQ